MVQAIDQAERERELTKQSLATSVDRLEARVRAELDWKARLRRDGPRIALVGGAVLAVGVGIVVLRRVLSGGDEKVQPRLTSIDEIAAELSEIRKRLDNAKVEAGGGPAWQKIAVRAASGAAAAGGTYAARRFMARNQAQLDVTAPAA